MRSGSLSRCRSSPCRQLVRDPPRFDLAGATVSVCENPVVLAAAAERLGPGCPPLVCTGGQPGAAVTALLRLLIAAGARVRHHGDFDWGGVSIATCCTRGSRSFRGGSTRRSIAGWRLGAAAADRSARRDCVGSCAAGRNAGRSGCGSRRSSSSTT